MPNNIHFHTFTYYLYFFLFISLFSFSFQSPEELTEKFEIFTKEKINFYCKGNTYFFEIPITAKKFDGRLSRSYFLEDSIESEEIEGFLPFVLQMQPPLDLEFKCSIDFGKDKIICFSNLENNWIVLEENYELVFPEEFPKIDNIIWNYESFVHYVNRRVFLVTQKCGEAFEQSEECLNDLNNPNCYKKYDINNIKSENWELIANINNITEGQCYQSQKENENNYNFKLYFNIIDGNLKKEFENANLVNEKYNISLLQEIWMPFYFMDIVYSTNKNTSSDITDNEVINNIEFGLNEDKIKFIHCILSGDITEKNYLSGDNYYFDCHIPIEDNNILNGPLKIVPFYDDVYFKIQENTKITYQLGKIFFNIKKTDNKNYFILGDTKKYFVCPEQPIFTIKNYDSDIYFKSMSNIKNEYSFELRGYLINGYDYNENEIIRLLETKEEIIFNLSVTDNLVDEDTEIKKTKATCILPKGSKFTIVGGQNPINFIEIKCVGKKISSSLNNYLNASDISINWLNEENKIIDKKIIIRWPYHYKGFHYKNIFSYSLYAFSLYKTNYGCYDNNFYFNIKIKDLNYEPDITFNLPLQYPQGVNAVCKLYDSVTLKCTLPLRVTKVSKNDKIRLIPKYNKIIKNHERNKIHFKVLSYDEFDPDFYLEAKEDCGDYAVFGALKKIGIGYILGMIMIIGLIAFVIIVIVCFIGCIIYRIKHRNRKGKYFAHIEEVSGIKGNNPKPTQG